MSSRRDRKKFIKQISIKYNKKKFKKIKLKEMNVRE